MEIARHHADDCEYGRVERESLSDDIRILRELALPQSITEHRNSRFRIQVLARCECSSEQRRRTHNSEEGGRYSQRADAFRITIPGYHLLPRAEGGNVLEGVVQFVPIRDIRKADLLSLAENILVALSAPKENQAADVLERQLA